MRDQPSNAEAAGRRPPDGLTNLPRWLLWRSERRGGRATKVPYRRDGRRASATEPRDWSSYAEITCTYAARPGFYSGLGIVLGQLADGAVLAGLDLDACLTAEGISAWAQPFLDTLRSYAEVSPSGTGIKVFFLIAEGDLHVLRERLRFRPEQNGCKRSFGTSLEGHPPAAELYLGGRYFAVTGARYGDDGPSEPSRIDAGGLAGLAALFARQPLSTVVHRTATASDRETLMDRLDEASARQPNLDARWRGDHTGLADASRSGFDMSLGILLRRAGFDLAEMRALLIENAHGAGAERAAAGDDRYFQRIWDRADTQGGNPCTGRAAPAAASRAAPGTAAEPSALVAVPARLPAPAAIPPRRWLIGTLLVRGFVTVLVAPGGVGKTALATAIALAVITGRDLLGDRVWDPGNAWIINLEDPLEEVERRVAAAMIRHSIPRDDVEDRLFLHSGRDRPVVLAALHEVDGHTIVFPDRDALIYAMREEAVSLLVVDPFLRSHRLEENSNPHMDAAAAAWAQVADATGAAVLLIHHTRKGQGLAGDIEGSRGAKALTDAARIGLLLSSMSVEEANALGVDPDERWRHVRLDMAKANLSPRADQARWFRLESVGLGNATETYPAGDHVQAIVPWTPIGPLADLSTPEINAVLDRIADAFNRAEPYAPDKRGSSGGARWAGHVLMEDAGRTEPQAKAILKSWLANGLLEIVAITNPRDRKPMRGLRVIDVKRPS